MPAGEADYDFKLVTYPVRVYSGRNALGNLPAEIKRQRARRAFIISGRTVSQKTGLIESMRALLGDALAGVYDRMRKDSPLPDVLEARDAARSAGADLLIAVGGGSLMQAVRVVAILLAEKQPPEEICTQYPEDGRRPISPKLLAPKLPIINVLTVGTTAQNRGGSPLKVEGWDHRMEFFDPKTRPVSIFWDADALMTAPPQMMRNSSAAIFWRALMDMGYTHANPLVDANRQQVFKLAYDALRQVKDNAEFALRINLCIATFLINRQADDGGGRVNHWVYRVTHAFSVVLFNLHEHLMPGQAYSAMTPIILRRLGHRDPECIGRMAAALGVWRAGDPIAQAPERLAAALEELFAAKGLPTRLSQLGIPRSSATEVVANSLKIFNVDPKREFVREQALLRETFDALW